MDDEKTSMAGSVIKELEEAGFRAAFIPFSCIDLITSIYNTHVDNSENTPLNIKEWFRSNQPPDILFTPASFLVIAFQSPEGELCLKHKGKKVKIPIPPAYLDDSTKQRLNEPRNLTLDGCQLAEEKGFH